MYLPKIPKVLVKYRCFWERWSKCVILFYKEVWNLFLHILVYKCSIFDNLYQSYGSEIPKYDQLLWHLLYDETITLKLSLFKIPIFFKMNILRDVFVPLTSSLVHHSHSTRSYTIKIPYFRWSYKDVNTFTIYISSIYFLRVRNSLHCLNFASGT